jgi:uncharacterized membrane protein (DUF373 family)
MKRFITSLNWAVVVIEVLVALALTILAAGALFALFAQIYHLAIGGQALTSALFSEVISKILEVFIMVELFRIAIAYMRHDNVVPTVLEAALVAIARKFVVFEGGTNFALTAFGMASLLLAVACAWWLLSRANACELLEESQA